MRAERLLGRVNGFWEMREQRENAKSKDPPSKTEGRARKFILGVIVSQVAIPWAKPITFDSSGDGFTLLVLSHRLFRVQREVSRLEIALLSDLRRKDHSERRQKTRTSRCQRIRQ